MGLMEKNSSSFPFKFLIPYGWHLACIARSYSCIVSFSALAPSAVEHDQRVLNDLQRARLSFGPTIWLLATLLPPSPVSKLSLFLSLFVCRRSSLMTGEGGSQIIRRRECLVLYKSFNALWLACSYRHTGMKIDIKHLVISCATASEGVIWKYKWIEDKRGSCVESKDFWG